MRRPNFSYTGIKVWSQAFVFATEPIFEFARSQPERDVRYALPGYVGGPNSEPMEPPAEEITAIVWRLKNAGLIPGRWATTAQLKRYELGVNSDDYSWYRAPNYYWPGKSIVQMSLTGWAQLSARTPEGVKIFGCKAGTVVIMNTQLEHVVSRPFGGEARYVLMVGQDVTMKYVGVSVGKGAGGRPHH